MLGQLWRHGHYLVFSSHLWCLRSSGQSGCCEGWDSLNASFCIRHSLTKPIWIKYNMKTLHHTILCYTIPYHTYTYTNTILHYTIQHNVYSLLDWLFIWLEILTSQAMSIQLEYRIRYLHKLGSYPHQTSRYCHLAYSDLQSLPNWDIQVSLQSNMDYPLLHYIFVSRFSRKYSS